MPAVNIVPVILAGGVGSRLWPLSRTYYPKQFHKIFGDTSFLQSTLLRARNVTDSAPILVCNEEHRFLVAEQCREVVHPSSSSLRIVRATLIE